METLMYVTKHKITVKDIANIADKSNYKIIYLEDDSLQIECFNTYWEFSLCSIENGGLDSFEDKDLDKFIELDEPFIFRIEYRTYYLEELKKFVKKIMEKYKGWLSEDGLCGQLYEYENINNFILNTN